MSSGNEKVYGYVTEKILTLLEGGIIPWQKPWKGDNSRFPKNIRSKKPYRGSNTILLWASAMSRGFSSPWWGTWKAWEEKGGVIIEDQKKESDFVTFFNMVPIYTDETKHLPKEQREIAWYRPILRYWRVWNAQQLENFDDIFEPEEPVIDFMPIEKAQGIVDGYFAREKVTLEDGQGRAFYRPLTDTIGMPESNSFISPEEYYDTLFHEMTHSTGHSSRLDRKEGMGNVFGDHAYSFEELVAQMGASMTSAVCEIEVATIENSAAYIQNWAKALGDHKEWIVRAGGRAQRAVDYILGEGVVEEEGDD